MSLFLHAGDFVSPFTALPLQKLEAEFAGVFGNNDGDRVAIAHRFEAVGRIYPGYRTFEAHGLRIVLMREPKSIDALVDSGLDSLPSKPPHAASIRAVADPFAQSLITL